jgi:hypothetical protein
MITDSGSTASKKATVDAVLLPWWDILSTVLINTCPEATSLASAASSMSPESKKETCPMTRRTTRELLLTSASVYAVNSGLG